MKVILDKPKPLSLHILLTTKCNLNCENCFYKRKNSEISFINLVDLIIDAYTNGVRSIAFGGGEPLLYEDLDYFINLANDYGLYTAVTTNGTIKKEIHPDRVHISYDKMHKKEHTIFDIDSTLNYYRGLGCKVGINHIITDLESIRSLPEVETVNLLLEKPESKFNDWDSLRKLISKDREKYWLGACLAKKILNIDCKQGITGMSIDSNMMCSRCSNISKKVSYTTFPETWEWLIKQKSCLISLEENGQEKLL